MSTPAFGLNHEYVAAMISLAPSSSPLLDCHTHPTTVEMRTKAMRRALRIKRHFGGSGSNGWKASRQLASVNHSTPEGSMRGYSGGRPIIPSFLPEHLYHALLVRSRKSQVLVSAGKLNVSKPCPASDQTRKGTLGT
jgi:hypothetical protein